MIWDPYLALAQSRGETRVLATTGQTHDVSSFFLANRTFAEKNPSLIAGALSGLTQAAGWARAHRDEVAQSLASVTGVPYPVQKVAADRTEFAVRPLSDEILTAQQTTADGFFRLGLIPRPSRCGTSCGPRRGREGPFVIPSPRRGVFSMSAVLHSLHPSAPALDIRRVAGRIGAEIRGVALSATSTPRRSRRSGRR